jgi:hypothetical protein
MRDFIVKRFPQLYRKAMKGNLWVAYFYATLFLA